MFLNCQSPLTVAGIDEKTALNQLLNRLSKLNIKNADKLTQIIQGE
jgi:hypothetical protein